MYKVIGNDGKTYGPVSVEKIREWIVQGRVDSRTAVIADGGEWTFLGLLPEFARELVGTPPVISPPKISGVPARNTNRFATAGFVCGLVSLTCCCGCPFNVLGLVFSLIALMQINGQVQKQEGWGARARGAGLFGVEPAGDFRAGNPSTGPASGQLELALRLPLNAAGAAQNQSAGHVPPVHCAGGNAGGNRGGSFFLQSGNVPDLSRLPIPPSHRLELSRLRHDAGGLRAVAWGISGRVA